MTLDTVVIDVDGTLLDSNYQHCLAWARAFAHVGLTVPVWRIHRRIGMGGDRLVPAVAGEDVEREHGDDVRARWKQEYDVLIDETRLLPGARELLAALHERGLRVALASSSIPEHARHAFELLDADELTDTTTTAEDAEESKPHPALVDEAVARLHGGDACVLGDSPWDLEAASHAGLPGYAVLCGGYGRAELTAAGAALVYDDPQDLLDHLDQWSR